MQDHSITMDLFTHGKVFQRLGHGADSVGGRVVTMQSRPVIGICRFIGKTPIGTNGKTGRPEGLPRTTAIKSSFADAEAPANKQTALALVSQVAKPGRHVDDGRTISFIVPAVQGA